MQVIYADSLFFINLIINYIMLLLTAKICAAGVKRLRLLAAALLGASYSVAVVLPLAEFLRSPLIKLAVGLLIVLAAYGGQARILRLTLVFFAVSAAFGGAVLAASLITGGGLSGFMTPVDMKILIPVFAVCYIVLSFVFKRAGKFRSGGVVTLKLRHGGREIEMRALRDTGNTLTDPMTGKAVVVAGVGDVTPLFPLGMRQIIAGLRLKDAVKVMEELATESTVRFQLIPYSAVGTAGGLLLAFRPDEIVIDGKNKAGMLLALSPNSVSDNGTYSALVGA